jgi:multidrug efflux pump subunit AcrA (membrane-fusion protein)
MANSRTNGCCFTVLLAATLLVGGGQARAATAMTTFAQAVGVTTPAHVELTRRLLATGSIYAWQEVIIAPEVGGYQVAAVNVDVGSQVRRGQELVRLSSELLGSQVEVARASVTQAQAGLANAAAALNRGETVFAAGALSRADLDTLRANHISAQAGVASAQANLDSAELKLRFTQVLRLLRQNRVEWRAEIPEADMHSVKPGQVVLLSTVEGLSIKGRVRTMAPTVQANNRTAIAYVDLPANSGARPGMFARGEINISKSAAMLLPVASVLLQDGYSYIFVLNPNDSTVQRRRVSTGVIQNGQIEVTQGLIGREQVVSAGGAFLTDGQKVSVKTAP